MNIPTRRTELGICQWFHYEDFEGVTRAVELMRDLGVRHLRTGVSWADFCRPDGRAWYDWQMEQLAEFDVLLSIWHTPPSLAEGSRCSGPPRRLDDFGEFVAYLIDLYGDKFSHVELWNEPNNRLKWDFENFDPDWRKFGRMIRVAARYAKAKGKPTVLGGMIPVDHHWLQLMQSHGALEDVDIIAIHGFPCMWWPDHPNWDWRDHWRGWEEKIAYLARWTEKPIWVTETGLATWDLDQQCESRFELQQLMLRQAAVAPAERVYWYSLIDLDGGRDAIEGFHVDENEYHLGLVRFDQTRKEAYHDFRALLREQNRHTATEQREHRKSDAAKLKSA